MVSPFPVSVGVDVAVGLLGAEGGMEFPCWVLLRGQHCGKEEGEQAEDKVGQGAGLGPHRELGAGVAWRGWLQWPTWPHSEGHNLWSWREGPVT